MLALGSTPALAQDAATAALTQPVIVLPPTTPAPAPAPAPVMQSPVIAPTVAPITPPVVAEPEAPVAETAAPAAPARATATRRAAAPAVQTSAPAAVAADPAPVVAEQPALPTATADASMAEPLPLPVEPVAEPVDSAAAQDITGLIALALAGIIPLGFAVFAFMWWRRRSRRTSYVPMETIEQPLPRRATNPAATAPVIDHAPYVPVDTPLAANTVATTPVPVMAMSSAQSRTSGEVVLPREMPKTFAERDRLLRQLVAAKPDRANPFKAPKARARRARLIMQSLGRKFDEVSPRFDLSQYSYLWPNLAKPQRSFA